MKRRAEESLRRTSLLEERNGIAALASQGDAETPENAAERMQ